MWHYPHGRNLSNLPLLSNPLSLSDHRFKSGVGSKAFGTVHQMDPQRCLPMNARLILKYLILNRWPPQESEVPLHFGVVFRSINDCRIAFNGHSFAWNCLCSSKSVHLSNSISCSIWDIAKSEVTSVNLPAPRPATFQRTSLTSLSLFHTSTLSSRWLCIAVQGTTLNGLVFGHFSIYCQIPNGGNSRADRKPFSWQRSF